LVEKETPKETMGMFINSFAFASSTSNVSERSLTTSLHESVVIISSEQYKLLKYAGMILSYLLLVASLYSIWVEEWSFIDALYFAVVTFTTVGYGDIQIKIGIGDEREMTTGLKIVTTIFVIVGIGVIGNITIALLTEALFDSVDNVSQKQRIISGKKYISELFPSDRPSKEEEKENMVIYDLSIATFNNIPWIILIFIPSIIVGVVEEWDVWTMIYYGVVTSTTVGYGDFAPTNQWMRLFAVIYIPTCVALSFKVVSNISGVYIQRKAIAKERKYLHSRRLNLKDFHKMDEGGNTDGVVTFDEFLVFMLQAMGKLDENTDIRPLKELFDRLDITNSGTLTAADVFGPVIEGETPATPELSAANSGTIIKISDGDSNGNGDDVDGEKYRVHFILDDEDAKTSEIP